MLSALSIVAFVVVCLHIGKTGPTGLGSQRIEDAAAASTNGDGTVIADDEGERLLFIDSSGRLVSVYGLADHETPITSASIVHQVGDDVFVAGVRRAGEGDGIRAEAVLRFDMSGEYRGTAWKKEYGEDDIQVTPSIADITTDVGDDLVLVQFDRQEMHAMNFSGSVTRVTREGTDEQVLREAVYPEDSIPFEIRYDPEGNRCAMTDAYGKFFVEQEGSDVARQVSTGDRALAVQSFDVSGDMAVLYDERSHALIHAANLFGDARFEDLDTDIRCDGVEICGDVVATITDAGAVRIYDLASGSSHELAELPLAPSLFIRQVALLLSRTYLVALCIIMAIRWAVRSVRQGHRAKVRRAIVATAVALICAAAMAFHMADVFDTTLLARQRVMSQIVSQASVTSPAQLGDAATNEARRAIGQLETDGDGEDLLTILSNVEGILASSFANGGGVQCTLYATTGSGEVRYLFSSARDSVVWGTARGDEVTSAVNAVVQAADAYGSEGGGEGKAYRFVRDGEVQSAVRRDKGGDSVVSCVAPLIARDGACCTALEVSCHAQSLMQGVLDNVLGILLMFAMTAASIYVISDETIRSGGVYLRYRKMREQGVEWAETLLGRSLCFAVNLAFGMDTAFAVVIAKDMLAGSGLDSTAFVWGVPALAITMGTAIGTLAHALLSSRVPGRSYALPALLLGMASQLLCCLAVTNNWFAVFVACKLVSSASFALTQLISTSLATSTHSKDLDDAQLSLMVCDSSANIAGKGAAVVASVVGGALAYIGAQWVYLAGALVSLTVIPLLLLALPKGRVISAHGERANLRNAFEFLRSPILLATLLFGILPTVLASGYKSYVLPLFLDSAGVSKTDISGLFALGNVILYGFSDTLITHRNARGRWIMTWVGLICLGALFVLFSYNQAPVWAVVSVVLITVLSWLAGDWKHNARGWAREDYGFSYDQSQTMLNIEESVTTNVQAPVLVALLSLGASVCCLILGIFFALSGACYCLSTRRRGGSS